MSRTSTTVALAQGDVMALSRRPPGVPPSTFVLGLVRDDVRIDGVWRGSPVSVSRSSQVATVCLSLPDALRTEIEGRVPPGVPVCAYVRSLLRAADAHVDGDLVDASVEGAFDGEDARPAADQESLATQAREIRQRIERLRAHAAAPEPEPEDDPAAWPGSVIWTRERDGTESDADELFEVIRLRRAGWDPVGTPTDARLCGRSYRFREHVRRYAVGVSSFGRSSCSTRGEVDDLLGEFAQALAATAARSEHRIQARYRVSGGAGVGWVADVSVVRTT